MPETANSGPMVGFQFLHPMKKNIKRDSKKFMSDNIAMTSGLASCTVTDGCGQNEVMYSNFILMATY
jgi:hypothetical protein